mmetsp:Transcript_86941/g.153727  ORF Transcript_86941/g.153727 Transcript_86941/m.153727 type:complete len:112 (-) Transcript_86941:458-793(-)
MLPQTQEAADDGADTKGMRPMDILLIVVGTGLYAKQLVERRRLIDGRVVWLQTSKPPANVEPDDLQHNKIASSMKMERFVWKPPPVASFDRRRAGCLFETLRDTQEYEVFF